MSGLLSNLIPKRRPVVSPENLPSQGPMPEFRGVSTWFNTEPLTKDDLNGKVVLIDFWTYSCINCIRTLPYLKDWHERYESRGLVIIGVHTPEFDFEKVETNVKEAIDRHGIPYPVVIDNDYVMWKEYRNHYWPAHYFVDRSGEIRYHHFGEGGYDHSEAVIRTLLQEDGEDVPEDVAAETAEEIDFKAIGTPETYLGFDRMEYLGSPESVRVDEPKMYSKAKYPALNVFYFSGIWTVGPQFATSAGPEAEITYRFKASRVNLVMDGGGQEKTVHVLLDGRPVDEDRRGADVRTEKDAAAVKVKEGRMYNLIDTRGEYGEHVLELRFLDPGVKTYAFTFG